MGEFGEKSKMGCRGGLKAKGEGGEIAHIFFGVGD
jgi:hypothetical protein